jgi:hypothetical protein
VGAFRGGDQFSVTVVWVTWDAASPAGLGVAALTAALADGPELARPAAMTV